MAHVSPNENSMEAESYVDLFPFLESSTWNHQGFLTWQECL
jgi:hypothetical protein